MLTIFTEVLETLTTLIAAVHKGSRSRQARALINGNRVSAMLSNQVVLQLLY